MISLLDRRFGSRIASALGPASILGGAVLMLAAGHRGSIMVIIVVALLVNFGISVSMTQSLNLVVSGVPADKVTEFNGLNFAIQAVAGTVGAQVSGAVLTVDGADVGTPPRGVGSQSGGDCPGCWPWWRWLWSSRSGRHGLPPGKTVDVGPGSHPGPTCQVMVRPPSTASVCPVTKAPAAEANQTAVAASSTGSPIRPKMTRGICASR